MSRWISAAGWSSRFAERMQKRGGKGAFDGKMLDVVEGLQYL